MVGPVIKLVVRVVAELLGCGVRWRTASLFCLPCGVRYYNVWFACGGVWLDQIVWCGGLCVCVCVLTCVGGLSRCKKRGFVVVR